MLLPLLTAVYVVCALALTAFALGTTVLLIAYLRYRNDVITPSQVVDLPVAAVQLPVYNELYVVERLLHAVAAMEYPREKLFIQVLDDSTDETTDLIARVITPLQTQGINITHVRRGSREGYKAGALAYGLSLLDVEYVVVLDADFIPPPDFLIRTIPYLVTNPKVGMVQTRWGHLNPDDNALTKSQALALDGHFVVEQTARSRAGLLMNFNGSGGVWRVKTIEEAGGWQDQTLTEDLDLSYRAQLIGWHFLYLPDVVVPGELPLEIAAYKQQQSRWAKGGTQCFTLLMGPVWRHPRLTLAQRIMATLHLSQYLVHPVIMLMILLTPPLLIAHAIQQIGLGALGIVGLGPPLLYIISQQALYGNWKHKLLALPALIALGTGMSWTNTRAVMSGLLNQREEFKRTPKFASMKSNNPAHKHYARLVNKSFMWEVLLSLYTLWGVWVAIHYAPGYIPYLLVYAIAFGVIAWWGVRDALGSATVIMVQTVKRGILMLGIIMFALAAVVVVHSQTGTPEPTCPNAPPTRLIVHERARVATEDPRPVNMRSQPGTDNDRIAQIASNEVFFVLEGPICSERYAWYRIDYNDMIGWIAEGDNTSYYVEVFPPGL